MRLHSFKLGRTQILSGLLRGAIISSIEPQSGRNPGYLCLRVIRGRAHKIDEQPVNTPVVGQLGVKCGSEDMALTNQDGRSVATGQNLNSGASFDDLWGADKDHFQGTARKFGFFGEDGGVDLAAIGVALECCIQQAKRALRRIQDIASKQDRPGAGAKDGLFKAELLEDLEEALLFKEVKDSCGFAAGQNEAVQAAELVGLADLDGLSPGIGEGVSVRSVVALDGENADTRPDS